MNPQFEKPGRNELIAILVIIVIGAALRLYRIESVTIEHFDEGVYASNFWFDEDNNFEYPKRPFFGPSLLPMLIEMSMLVFGFGSFGVLSVNLIAGILTIPVIWLLGRSWFGPSAGLIAAGLCSFSEFHIAYSRTALTDPLMLFFFLIAVLLGSWGLQKIEIIEGKPDIMSRLGGKHGILLCVFAGVFTALAWWTKYNGWLPLAVLISGYIAWKIIERKESPLIDGLLKLAIIVAIAIIAWLPYLNSIQEIGGYAAISENHKQYVVGWTGWPESFQRQVANLRFFESIIGILGVLVAFLFAYQKSKTDSKLSPTIFVCFPFLLGFFYFLGVSAIFALTTAAVLLWELYLKITKKSSNEQTPLPYWLLAAWVAGLLLATPLYTPYPRLVLPLLSAIWVGGGYGVVTLGSLFFKQQVADQSDSKNQPIHLLLDNQITPFVLVLAVFILLVTGQKYHAWESRDDFRTIAHQIVQLTEAIAREENGDTDKIGYYVYAEPALFYHLSAEDKVAGPSGNLKFADPEQPRLDIPTFLLTGPHANRSSEFKEEWKKFSNQFTKIAEYEYHPSSIVQLNNFSPKEILKTPDTQKAETITLYRLKN